MEHLVVVRTAPGSVPCSDATQAALATRGNREDAMEKRLKHFSKQDASSARRRAKEPGEEQGQAPRSVDKLVQPPLGRSLQPPQIAPETQHEPQVAPRGPAGIEDNLARTERFAYGSEMSEALVITRREARVVPREAAGGVDGKTRRQPAIVRRKRVSGAQHAVMQSRKSEAAPEQVAMVTAEAPDWLFEAVAGATMHPRHDELDRKLKAARRSKAAAKLP